MDPDFSLRSSSVENREAFHSKKEVEEEKEVQEGGIQGWCTLAGTWLSLFATFGYLSSFGVY
ncbi:hypothetical protein M422DRAFT_259690 [Sphaerobolus stellatus SS14]|uniref:Uncharacterized protein n=1 Tax=Sphaerobolus stellatus (strain SS14) TaxID=990650 RepID=A0A0C9VJK0_SPHS4|nr:hypothetical protein M422DRAFT_259690 [Sphaerobolus stellatus SS14]